MNKTNDPYYIEIMGGVQLNIRTFEGQRFLRNIIRMPGPKTIISKELGYLLINDWTAMLDYIEEHDQ